MRPIDAAARLVRHAPQRQSPDREGLRQRTARCAVDAPPCSDVTPVIRAEATDQFDADAALHGTPGPREALSSTPARRVAGLEPTAQTRDFIAVSTGTSRAEYYSVFKNPIESANGWQRQLSPQSVREVMDMVSRFESGRHYRNEAAA